MAKEIDLVFGVEFRFDWMFLDENAVLHIVNITTNYSGATYLDSKEES